MDHVWIVFDHCDCEDLGCVGRLDIEVFVSEQTARQAAEVRAHRYGGSRDFPDMHLQRVPISSKISRY